MKKTLITLCVAAFAGVLSAEELASVDLDSSNASNKDPSTFYKWSDNTYAVASSGTINFNEGGLAIIANRGIRDFFGTINLAAGATDNFLYVGSNNPNQFGFSGFKIVGGDTTSSLTISEYTGGSYKAGHVRVTGGGALFSVDKANVTLTDLQIGFESNKNTGLPNTTTGRINLTGGATINYNIGALYSMDLNSTALTDVNNDLGMSFISSDKTGKVVFGENALLNNMTFNGVAVTLGDNTSFTGTNYITEVAFNKDVSFEKVGGATINLKDFVKGQGVTVTVGSGTVAGDINTKSNLLKVTGDLTTNTRTTSCKLYITSTGSITSGNGSNNVDSLVVEAGGSFSVLAQRSMGGMALRGNSDIDGSILIVGGRTHPTSPADQYAFAIQGNTTTFGANATLDQQTYSATMDSYLARGARVVSNSAKGALKLANILKIGDSARLVLNTTDAWISGYASEACGATSQATSVFAIVNHYDETASTLAILEINAANNIGGFLFDVADSRLKLHFGADGSLVLGESESVQSLSGSALDSASIVLSSELTNKLRVYDLTEEEINKYFTTDSSDLIIEAVKQADGSYFVNVVSNVPEPATCAAILGGLAIAFALIRRRR